MHHPVRAGIVAVAAGTIAGVIAPLATSASAATSSTIRDNVAPYARHATPVGRASASSRIGVTVYLTPRNAAGLQSTVAALYARGSSRYHRWLTPAQFHRAYSPDASTVDAVRSWLGSSGLTVLRTPASRLRVDATGTVAQVEKTFGVTENLYRVKGRTLRANSQNPRVPTSIASHVLFVGGLDQEQSLIHPDNTVGGGPAAKPGAGYSTPTPCTSDFADPVTGTATPAFSDRGVDWPNPLTWLGCGYTPDQIRGTYGLGAASPSDTAGAGATIGIVDAFVSPTLEQDANQFFADHNLSPFTSDNFSQIYNPGIRNVGENAMDPQGWYGEQSLDVEWAHAMAPGAKIVYVGANNSETPLDHALADLIDSGKADVITDSWGFYGEPSMYGFIKPVELSFMQAAVQGESILFSSGDDGDVANPTDIDTGIAQGSYPASSPWVTAVGGTSVLANSDGPAQQWGWGTFSSTLLDDKDKAANNSSEDSTDVSGDHWSSLAYAYGGGGGTSLHFTMDHFPLGDYQAGVVPEALATSTKDDQGNTVSLSGTHRVVPDISMLGDPNTGALYGETYVTSGDPLIDAGCTSSSYGTRYEYCERRIGGTSLASPLFSGVVAQVVAAHGRQGLLNPALYAGYAAQLTSGGLSDITAPTGPTGLLRNFQTSYGASETSTLRTVFRPINEGPALPSDDTITFGSGGNSLFTGPQYDNLTGLGTVGDVGTFVSGFGG
ncbi:MAG TPA: S53 family peptidase [Mycobacteriales bacterium]|jgi:subtilase family serine protease|nr:S53 family peptidase [Mycobacteriales bacterium]